MIYKNLLWHYCSLETFVEILKKCTLRMTDISKSNDSDETKHIYRYVQDQYTHHQQKFLRKLYEKNILPTNDNIGVPERFEINETYYSYVCCFSYAENLLSQWHMYADQGRGVSIGFGPEQFKDFSENLKDHENFKGISLNYDLSAAKANVDNLLEECFNNILLRIAEPSEFKICHIAQHEFYELRRKLALLQAETKSPAFSAEQEYRLIFTPNTTISDNSVGFSQVKNHKLKTTYPNFRLNGPIFTVSNNNLRSFCELSFRTPDGLFPFIRKIYIGPKCSATVQDIRYFLSSLETKNSFHSFIDICKSDITYR